MFIVLDNRLAGACAAGADALDEVNHHHGGKAEEDVVHVLAVGAKEEHDGGPHRGHEPGESAAERRPCERLRYVVDHARSSLFSMWRVIS